MFCLYRGLTLELGYIQCLRAGLTALQRGHGQSQVQSLSNGQQGEGGGGGVYPGGAVNSYSTSSRKLACAFHKVDLLATAGSWSRCSTMSTITKGSVRASPSLDATRPLTRALWEP